MRKTNYTFLLIALAIFGGLLYATSITPNAVDPTVYKPAVYSTIASLLPPVIAIALALITKEVYSFFVCRHCYWCLIILNGNLELFLNTFLYHEDGGMITKLADSWSVGILVFLVVLGIMVALMNKVGGSAAFGQWASQNIKTRVGGSVVYYCLRRFNFRR